MRNPKVMTLTEKGRAFDAVFRFCLEKHNAGDHGRFEGLRLLSDIIDEVLQPEVEDWASGVYGERVELVIYDDIRASIEQGKEALAETCETLRTMIEESGASQLNNCEAIELSILKWTKNTWNPETCKWTLGHGSKTCPLCAIYRNPVAKTCGMCPMNGTCVTDAMLTALDGGNKEPMVAALEAARRNHLCTVTFSPADIAQLLAKEAAVEREATVTFEIANNVLTGVTVKEK